MNVVLLGSLAPASLSAEELQHHGAATFLLDGISRAASHQLVRHRLASFSQESHGYVDLSTTVPCASSPGSCASSATSRWRR